MIRRDFYALKSNGKKLYRSFSDNGFLILQEQTNELYEEAIDVEDALYTYKETDIKISESAKDI